MTNVTFAYKDIEAEGLDRESIDRLIPRIGMDIEKKTGSEITIDVTPNRPDLIDFVGMRRSLLYLSGKKTPKSEAYKIDKVSGITINIKENVKKIRPFISGFVVDNADLSGDKLAYLINFTEKFCETFGRQRRKVAIGLHSLDRIEGNLTYGLADNGKIVPLGSDKEVEFDDLIKNNGKGRLYANTILKGKNKSFPFLSDEKKNIAIIPIINSELTRVTSSTKNLFVDITGTSENAVSQTASILGCSFVDSGAEIRKCTIVSGNSRMDTPELSYKDIRLKIINIERTLGAAINQEEAITLLGRMGHTAAKYGSYILVHPPPYRIDILDEQDVIDDIAIAYGYDRIVPQPIFGFAVGSESEETKFINELSRLMIGIGYMEVMNTYLTNEKTNYEDILEKENSEEALRVVHSKTENLSMLRTLIFPQLLANLGSSGEEKTPMKIFEIGKAFLKRPDEKIIQLTKIAFAIEHSKASFSEIKSHVEAVMKHVSKSYSLETLKKPFFIEGRAAVIKVGSSAIGILGEIHPSVLENFGIREPVIAAEISIMEEIL